MAEKSLTINKPPGDFNISIDLPPSKSILNRKLILEYLVHGSLPEEFMNPPGDVAVLYNNLKIIDTCSRSAIPLVVDIKDSGTATRFLTALLSVMKGTWLVTGTPRMKERPIGALVEALCKLGADITFAERKDFLPLKIKGGYLSGHQTTIRIDESTQFLSALMMIAPLLDEGLNIRVEPADKLHNPYVRMTLEILKIYGVEYELTKDRLTVKNKISEPGILQVEKDWSSASFWYEIIALSHGSKVFLKGMQKYSMQGDAVLPMIFEHFGVQTRHSPEGIILSNSGHTAENIVLDFINNPDLAIPVIITSSALGIPGTFKGLDTLKYKESDRYKAVLLNLKNLGVDYLEKDENTIVLRSGISKKIPVVNPLDDHRMAMALAPLALVQGDITVEKPAVVNKSYPDYWEHLKMAGFGIESTTG